MCFFVGSDISTHPWTLESALCIIVLNLYTTGKALAKDFMLNAVLICEDISAFAYNTMNK